jgi:ketosteroid isomerase-like protein
MSQENVDRLRAGYEAYSRTGEFPVENFDSDAEWVVAREDPDAATHRGVEAIRGYLAQWAEMFEDIDLRAEEVIDAGDKLFVWTRFSGKGITSGASVQMELAHVYTVRDGKLVRVEEYFDRREALEAAGVSEQDAHADS